MGLPIIFLGAIIFLFLVSRFLQQKNLPKGSKHLPGPKGWPIIGNLLEIPAQHPWLKFKKLGEKYGPIVKLDIFGDTHVIITSANVAEDLLSLKGSIYSDRGNFHMVNMTTRGHDLLSAPVNSYWRRGRKFGAAMLTSTMAAKWEPFQTREARRLVIGLLQEPEKY